MVIAEDDGDRWNVLEVVGWRVWLQLAGTGKKCCINDLGPADVLAEDFEEKQ
jgi:hypothetical protein